MISIKSAQDLEIMRTAGRILAKILHRVQEAVRDGVTTDSLDRLAAELMARNKVESAFWDTGAIRAISVFPLMSRLFMVFQATGSCMKAK